MLATERARSADKKSAEESVMNKSFSIWMNFAESEEGKLRRTEAYVETWLTKHDKEIRQIMEDF